MPFFTILHTILDLIFYFLASLHPVYSLVISSVYFSGLLTQWSIWMDCEVSGIGFENACAVCFQAHLDRRTDSMIPFRSSEGIVNGRVGLGGVIIALYALYAVLAALTVLRNRRGAKVAETVKMH